MCHYVISILLSTEKFMVYIPFDRVMLKVERSDFGGAITDFNKAIEFNPAYANSYFTRGSTVRFYALIFFNNHTINTEFINFFYAFLNERIIRNVDDKLEFIVFPFLINIVI